MIWCVFFFSCNKLINNALTTAVYGIVHLDEDDDDDEGLY